MNHRFEEPGCSKLNLVLHRFCIPEPTLNRRQNQVRTGPEPATLTSPIVSFPWATGRVNALLDSKYIQA